MTTQPKNDLPTHVTIHSSGRVSTALCEQVHTVDLQRMTSYYGTCTKEEMVNIDMALMISLGLDGMVQTEAPKVVEKIVEVVKEVPVEVIKEVPVASGSSEEVIALKAQLTVYRTMYEDLLRKAMGKRKVKGKADNDN